MKFLPVFLVAFILLSSSIAYSQTTQNSDNVYKTAGTNLNPTSISNPVKDTPSTKQQQFDPATATTTNPPNSSNNIDNNKNQSISKTQQALKDEYNKKWNSTDKYKAYESQGQIKKELKLANNFKANEALMKQPSGNNVLSLDKTQIEKKNKADQYEKKVLDRLHQQ